MNQENNQTSTAAVRRGARHEGPRNHVIAFIISMILTLLAFLAVMIEELSRSFVLSFIVLLAIGQVVLQLAFWMHLKDRGHSFPAVFLAMGAFVAFTVVITGVYWVWW